MTAVGVVLLVLCVVLSFRNILGGSWKQGIVAGRAATILFAGLAAYFLFSAYQARVQHGNPEGIVGAQRLMVGCLLAMVLSAYGAGVQRRKLPATGACSSEEAGPR